MSPTRTQENLPETPPEALNAYRQIIDARINALGVRTDVQGVLGKQTVDNAEDIQRLARSSSERIRAIFATPLEHGDERFEVRRELPRERPPETRAAPPTRPEVAPPPAPPTTPASRIWPIMKAAGNAVLKAGEFTAGATAATLPFVFETSRNFILNIPLLGDALKGAATLTEPLAKGLLVPLQSKIIAGAGFLKNVPILKTVAPAVAPYILPAALTGGGLYGASFLSEWVRNVADKKLPPLAKTAIFRRMFRGAALPWHVLVSSPALVKKGFNVVKKVSAPLFRHKIGTYGGAYIGYSVLGGFAGLSGGAAVPLAIAGAALGRYIQKRWFSGKAAAPKLEAAPEH